MTHSPQVSTTDPIEACVRRPGLQTRRSRAASKDAACVHWWTCVRIGAVVFVLAAMSAISSGAHGQSLIYSTGQNVAPSFEGWQARPDGTFDLLFGYLNRNLDEELDIPIGAENNVEPVGPDRGQPTHFLPRRNRYVFRVNVPKDFGAREVVWTLTAKAKTEKAYGSLKPDYEWLMRAAGLSGVRVVDLTPMAVRASVRMLRCLERVDAGEGWIRVSQRYLDAFLDDRLRYLLVSGSRDS
jgi:hypothetical protein